MGCVTDAAWFAVGIVVTLTVRGRAPASRVLSDLSSAPTSAPTSATAE